MWISIWTNSHRALQAGPFRLPVKKLVKCASRHRETGGFDVCFRRRIVLDIVEALEIETALQAAIQANVAKTSCSQDRARCGFDFGKVNGVVVVGGVKLGRGAGTDGDTVLRVGYAIVNGFELPQLHQSIGVD